MASGSHAVWTEAQRAEVADLAAGLQQALAQGDDGAAGQSIVALSRYAELYYRLGAMTRSLHEQLQVFLRESNLADLAERGTSDTRQRLDQVISLTDDAAHKTLDAAEQIRQRLSVLESSHPQLVTALQEIRTELEAITLAQGYQDLSGQLIRRATTMIADMEQQLVALLRLLADDSADSAASPEARQPAEVDWTRGQGPKVAGTETGDHLSNQDEVDDLLKSLGF